MEQIIRDNISAIFALLGTLAGAALTFFGTWILQSKEARTRLLEKVLDRRIRAHEQIIQLSKLLRAMVSLGYPESNGELARTPNVMASSEAFDAFLSDFSKTCGENSTWLSTEVTRELNFIQDYLINLYEFLREVNSDKFPEVGCFIRQDFVDFSGSIENLAFKFFTHDLTRLKVNDLRKWHKYPIKETEKRLTETAFYVNREEIVKAINKR